MKFLVRWEVHQEKRIDTITGFSQMSAADDLADLGDDVKLIGRWHDVASFTGVAIVESDNASAIGSWALNWSGMCDLSVTPVLDDKETRAMAKAKLNL